MNMPFESTPLNQETGSQPDPQLSLVPAPKKSKPPQWAIGLIALCLFTLSSIFLGASYYYVYNILPEDQFYSVYEAPWSSLNSGNYHFKGMQDFQTAKRKLQANITAHPHSNDPKPHYLLAKLYNDLGNATAAEQEYQRVIQISNASWTGQIINQGFVRASREELAILYYLRHDYKNALAQLNTLGKVYSDFLSAMRDSLESPERADFHLLLGKAFAEQLLLKMSAQEVKRAMQLSNTPQLQLEASNFLKAHLPQGILELSPLARYYSFSGEAYENDEEDLIQAADAYERVVKAAPRFEWGYNDLAKIYRDLKDFKRAESNARQAIRLNPDFYNPHLTLGDLALDRKHYVAAITHFQDAKVIMQRFAGPETQHLIGNLENQIAYAYECEGRTREAERHYQQAMLAASEDEENASTDYDYAQEGLARTRNASQKGNNRQEY